MTDQSWQLAADDLCSIHTGLRAPLLAEALRASGDWLDVTCGRETVFVHFDLAVLDGAQALAKLATCAIPSNTTTASAPAVDIPACYHPEVAPDLAAVCAELGLSRNEFVRRHTAGDHEVAMLGFMPGFAYIDGLDPSLEVSRLEQPRQQVAAGSIGLAGRQTGIYPFEGPGGWRLVARTPLALFDVDATPPARLKAMQKVRFVPISLDELEAMQ
ncbi:MAG: allophanate hydrolase subunit 1 [Pseudomonadota bacterium]